MSDNKFPLSWTAWSGPMRATLINDSQYFGDAIEIEEDGFEGATHVPDTPDNRAAVIEMARHKLGRNGMMWEEEVEFQWAYQRVLSLAPAQEKV